MMVGNGDTRLLAPTVPFADLSRLAPTDRIRAAVDEVLEDGRFVGGPAVALFEQEFAQYCGTSHCVGVSSGTAALQAALQAYGVGRDDEVITVAATFVATAAAIVTIGAVPVFVDIDPVHRTCRPDLVRAAVTPRTKAIVPVDYYGHPADMTALREIADEYGLILVADGAQAHGATYRGRRVGSLADVTCFSFYPSKNLGALGDAGAVTTDDPVIAERIRQLRNHGRGQDRDDHARIGQNWRLDTIQAAALLVKLSCLDEWNALRREAARQYGQLLSDTEFELPAVDPRVEHAYHLYVVRHQRRDAVRLGLAERGVDTRVHYPCPVHLMPIFRRYRTRPLPDTEALAAECLSLPLFPGITEAELHRVATAVHQVLRSPRA
jgi:dTDP-4-amino-4,6-dideoxygalactose transaminase